eukprot:2722046-Alexandrium_andersonii.AAC.1
MGPANTHLQLRTTPKAWRGGYGLGGSRPWQARHQQHRRAFAEAGRGFLRIRRSNVFGAIAR